LTVVFRGGATKIAALLILLGSDPATAQRPPEAGGLLQQQRQMEERVLPLTEFPESEREKEVPAESDGSQATVTVSGFRLTGSITRFEKADLLAQLESAIGRSHTFDGLQHLAKRITDHYHQHGYFLARAYLPRQEVTDGIVTIAIQEGVLDDSRDGVKVSGERLRANRDFSRRIFRSAVAPGEPLQHSRVERGVLLLNQQPGVDASASFEPGHTPGSTRAVLGISEDSLLGGGLSIDNFGSRYTGTDRVNVGASVNNLVGYGDQVTMSATRSVDVLDASGNQGSYEYLSLGASSSVGVTGLRAGVAYSVLDYALGKEFAALNGSGRSRSTTLYLAYPLYLTRMTKLRLSAAYGHKSLYDEVNGTVLGDKRLKSGSVGLNLGAYDRLLGGGFTQAGITGVAGSLDLSRVAAALRADSAGLRRQGDFSKLEYRATRYQKLTGNLTVVAGLRGQIADSNLDSSEQLQGGGPYAVRAYPVGEGVADEGFILNLDARYTLLRNLLLGNLQASVFFDRAELRQRHDPGNVVQTGPNAFRLAGWGMGFHLERPGRSNIALLWARKSGRNPLRDPITGNDSDGTSDRSRVFVSASVKF
jgi:hemolysin activation/secretion protein